jgi:hypothetical protein
MGRWTRWRDLPRWLKRTLVIGVSLLFLTPIVTNLVLWLRVVPRVLNADSAALSYGFAWSPWPTRVKLHDLLVTGQDPNVQFAVALDEAWVTLDLFATASQRTITISKLRGSGVSVRALQRLDPWALDDAKVNALPLIPGRTKPPITHAHVPDPPATRDHYDKISLDVRDIDATAKELWIDEARYVGRMRVTGAFLFRPGLELHIGPNAAVDFQGGEVSIAGKRALAGVKGRAEAETPYFNPVETEGVAILRFFSGSVAVRAQLANVEFASYFLAPLGVSAAGGAGQLALDFGFDRGVVRRGTKLELISRDLHVTAASTRIHTSLTLKAAADAGSHGAAVLTTDQLSVGPRDGKARLAGGELRVDIAPTGPLDLAKPLPPLHYAAALSRLAGSVDAVRPYLPKSAPVTLDAGQLSIAGEVSGTTGKRDLRAALEVTSAFEAHAEDRRFSGNLDARGKLRETPDRLDLTGTSLRLSDLMVAKGKDVTYGWWTHAEVLGGGAFTGTSPRLELDLGGGLRDIEPMYVAVGRDIGIPDWVQGLLPLPNTAWRGHLETEAGAVSVRDFRATSGSVEVVLKLTKPPEEEPSGAIKLASGPLSFGVAFARGETKNELFATDAWFEKQR